jgi:hypothetical protein
MKKVEWTGFKRFSRIADRHEQRFTFVKTFSLSRIKTKFKNWFRKWNRGG